MDLVVPADGLLVPSTSRGSHSPVLIRVWDEHGLGAGGIGVSPISPIRTEDETEAERRGDGSDVRFVVTVDGAEARRDYEIREGGEASEQAQEDVTQTPPAYARVDGYGLGIPVEEEDHNPWA